MLYEHQKKFLRDNPNKSALVWSCGTGKTRTAIEWVKMDAGLVLIICPKSLKTNWYRECERWGLSNKKIYTKEEFRKLHKDLMKFDQVIVDEVHSGFLTPNFKSQMSKSLRWYLKQHNVERVLLLSATVYTSSPWNIFNLAVYLGHKWNWAKFDYKFFYKVWMGQRQIPMVRKGSEKELARMTKQIASVVDIHDCMDVPLQLHCEPEYFSLTKEQAKVIENELDPMPIVKYVQQHEIENGILLGNEFVEPRVFDYDKMDRIVQLVEENPKIAIVARYNFQIDQITLKLADYKPKIIRGDVKDRDAVCLAAEKEERAVVLIQADSAEGYQLPSFELCVFVSQSYSYTKWEQICGRFLRMDKPSRTTFIYLLTEGDSVDQGVYDAVKRKEDFKIELFAKNHKQKTT